MHNALLEDDAADAAERAPPPVEVKTTRRPDTTCLFGGSSRRATLDDDGADAQLRSILGLLVAATAALLVVAVLLVGVCVVGARDARRLLSEMRSVRANTDGVLVETQTLTNLTSELLALTALIHVAILNTTTAVARTDRHAANIIANTYEMCNVLTVGKEKETGCRNNIGFPAGGSPGTDDDEDLVVKNTATAVF
eukprot:CAMPEP_0185702720 /NCGR_PEP_ID=MMETSP1164-20130828/12700_1 /TAXON_ID=1104430 /ORGANISM="Chrysoreinhardia sp, Strain CCMP2950" /LENGTH=195 /DNA_ID=CAMNT_0028369959 /DNA_START=36 /DNA_END=623 /DNA_ORIENTATION=-